MDVVDLLLQRYNRVTFSVQFPQCFDDLKGRDANFEMVASNTLQPLKLVYNYNVVTRKVARIFVNTYTGGLLDDQTLVGGIAWSQLKH